MGVRGGGLVSPERSRGERLRTLVLSTLILTGCIPPALLPPGPMLVIREAGPTAMATEDVADLVLPGEAPERARTAPERRDGNAEVDAAIARAALGLMDHPLPSGYADDCSGYVAAAASRAGVDLPPATRLLWEVAEASGAVHHDTRPALGDLVFFDDTWDKDHDGHTNDPLTHVGIVVRVDDDGTIHVAHRSSSGGRTTLRMNLERPHDRFDENGHTLNDYLRRAQRGDPPGTQYLSSELCRGFATPSLMELDAPPRG